MKEISEKINRFVEMEPNWDGEGAEKISKYSIEKALTFLKEAIEYIDDFPVPLAVPVPYGSVQLEWDNKDNSEHYEIEFRDNEILTLGHSEKNNISVFRKEPYSFQEIYNIFKK